MAGLWQPDRPAEAPPDDLVLREQPSDGRSGRTSCMSNWKVNYRYAIDNVMDPMHGAYLHAASHSMADDRQGSRHVLGELRQCTGGASSVVVRSLDRPLSGDEITTASVADGSASARHLNR
jgi:phenylpropionate dioxygenase-like ring-hydroxylating dioxygenase large terminal subunit